MQRPDSTRIVILGGGFAGLTTAMRLQRLLPERELDLTLVNRDNHFLFTPMLHEVAASEIEATHIVNPLRKLLRKGTLFTGDVQRVDLANRRVTVTHAEGRHGHELPYDHLVLALGSITNFFGIPGIAERALTMRTLGDAIALRNRILRMLDEADFECAAGMRRGLLTILVVGGGFAGVETAAALNDFLRHALRFYPHLAATDLRLVLAHAGPTILPELAPRLGRFAQVRLAERGVEVLLDTSLTGVSSEGLTLSDGRTLEATTLVWAAGNAPNPILEQLPCERQGGRLLVSEQLQVPGWPGVWALGDCALVPDPMTGGYHPPTAQHALRQGRLAARNIAAAIGGRPLSAFRFTTIGQLAAIGRRTGVASIFGMRFSGFLAWWLWRTIYLAKLPRFERKLRVALDWSLDLAFSRDLVELPTGREGVLVDGAAE